MWSLKFKAQPINAFVAIVNQMFGGSSQLPTTAECALNQIVEHNSGSARQLSEAGRGRRTFG